MTNPNLSIWTELQTTDPEFTKEFKRAGGFTGTAINPMYCIKKMTEKFGPIGKGWGIEVANEQLVPCGEELLVFVQVGLWWSEQIGDKHFKHVVGPQWGGDRVITKRKDGGLVADDEAFKKAMTDGMTKCMSYLGIGADLHLGFYDDNKYVNQINREFTGESTMPVKKAPKEPRPTDTAPAASATPAASGTGSADVGMMSMPPVDKDAEAAAEVSELQKAVDHAWGLAQTLLLEKHAGDVKAARDEATRVSKPWLQDVNTKDKKAKLLATKVGLAHFVATLNEQKAKGWNK